MHVSHQDTTHRITLHPVPSRHQALLPAESILQCHYAWLRDNCNDFVVA